MSSIHSRRLRRVLGALVFSLHGDAKWSLLVHRGGFVLRATNPFPHEELPPCMR